MCQCHGHVRHMTGMEASEGCCQPLCSASASRKGRARRRKRIPAGHKHLSCRYKLDSRNLGYRLGSVSHELSRFPLSPCSLAVTRTKIMNSVVGILALHTSTVHGKYVAVYPCSSVVSQGLHRVDVSGDRTSRPLDKQANEHGSPRRWGSPTGKEPNQGRGV